MERVIRESLEDRLARGRLPFDEALDILDQIARALDAAHEHGVVHRDLKPANIFLARARAGERAVVKLLDFGLAKLAADIDRRAERTQSGVVIGTAMYISPEQARGPNVDARTDVYALGCIAYELVLGRPPFDEAPSVAAMIAAHLHHAPPAPEALWPEIPPALGVALRAMVAKEPAHRPTLAQLRQVIARFRSPSIVDVRGVATDPRVAADVRASVAPVASTSRIPAARRNPIPVVPIVAVGALGVALVVWLAINAAAGRSSRTVTPSEDARHSAGPQVITVQPMVAPDAGAPTPLAVEFDAGLSPNAHVAPQTASAPPPLISESPTVDAGTRPVAAVVLDATVVAAPVATLDASVVAPPIHRVPPKPFNPNGTIDPFGGTP